MEPSQFRKGSKVRHLDQIGSIVLSRKNPPKMTVYKALMTRRMHVLLRIRMQMMVPVFRGPPQNTLLGAALSEERKDELKEPARRIGPVREIPMISRPDPEHAQPVQRNADCNRLPCDACPERSNATEVY